ncbi:MAG: DUF116 domain-containing protein [Bacteroidales bacterium]|nr:DUF116 domain-containing protein [Bacteroidales bacterium]
MSSLLPYSLNAEQQNSDSFYLDLECFTDLMILKADACLGRFTEDYYIHNQRLNKRIDSSRHEYLLELLMIGIFWTNYSTKAIKTNRFSTIILTELYKLRKRYPSQKSRIDKIRGILAYQLLEQRNQALEIEYTDKNFYRLLNWLHSTDEFNEEVKKMKSWLEFFKTKNNSYIWQILNSSCYFAERFSSDGKNALGKYTTNIECFQAINKINYQNKEDYFLVNRKENEYHLNMFGAELLNRELKSGFLQTKKKVLLLPTCMRKEPASGCKVKDDGIEKKCTYCNSNCNIGKIAAQMKLQSVRYLYYSSFIRFHQVP